MPELYNTTTDSSNPITTIAELITALPIDPVNPSIYSLDSLKDQIIQIVYGDPDRFHHTVKVITSAGVERKQYDTIEDAREAFLKLAQAAF